MVTGHSAKSRAASVAQDLLDSFVAFVTTAVAREIDEVRGEGVSRRVGGDVVVCIDGGCIDEEEVNIEGGRGN